MSVPATPRRPDPYSQWVIHVGTRLHYLDSRRACPPPPILFVPGMGDTATEYRWMLDAWAPHRCVIVDLRGRGASDAPERGYTVDDHVGDLDAVVADARIGPVHLVAYSRGTTYALAWALEHPDSVLSLTVGDYRAEQIVPPDGWASWWMSTSWRGIPMTERMQPHVVHEVARDVTAISYWSRLAELPCPVLVIRPDGRSLLDDPALEQWRRHRPDVEVVVFDGSDHDIFAHDQQRLVRTWKHRFSGG